MTSQLVRTAQQVPTLLVTSSTTDAKRLETLRSAGCQVLTALGDQRDHLDVDAILDYLGGERLTNVLVEGGAEVLGSFLDTDAIDEVHVFIAAKLLGGKDAKTAITGAGRGRIADSLRLANTTVEVLDGDFYVHGWK